jgi:hypothetical protein
MRTAGSANQWKSVAYGNGMFVAVSSSGTGNRVMTSPDGITWTSRTSAADYSWSHIIYANNLYVASSSGSTYVMTSANGILWTLKNVYATGGWSKWAMSPAKLLTISGGGSSGVALYSPPASGSSAGGAEQSLYLYGTNPYNLSCPSGWTDAGAGENSVGFGSYATYTYARSCYMCN